MLIFEVGNTRITRAETDGETLGPLISLPTAEFEVPGGEELLLVSSVVPDITEAFRRRGNVFLLQNAHAAACGLSLDAVDASTLGADRLANAIELVHQAKLPALTIDFGTAINCEIVDRSGVFRGGAIAPGRRMMLQSLYGNTAQLPKLSARGTLRETPGTNTLETILFGVDQGVLGMVKRWIECAAEVLHEMPRIVGIGGDAALYAEHISGMEPGAVDFTLQGLLYAWRNNRQTL